MEFIAITQDGAPAKAIADLPDMIAPVLAHMAAHYAVVGYSPPWIGYIVLEEGRSVGTCAFKSSPLEGRVEIAYFTFPGHEGRGIATRMASALVSLAQQTDPGVTVLAQTLPTESASTSVLAKAGFGYVGEVDHPEDGRVWEWHHGHEGVRRPSAVAEKYPSRSDGLL